jgi:hypothetical protein
VKCKYKYAEMVVYTVGRSGSGSPLKSRSTVCCNGCLYCRGDVICSSCSPRQKENYNMPL